MWQCFSWMGWAEWQQRRVVCSIVLAVTYAQPSPCENIAAMLRGTSALAPHSASLPHKQNGDDEWRPCTGSVKRPSVSKSFSHPSSLRLRVFSHLTAQTLKVPVFCYTVYLLNWFICIFLSCKKVKELLQHICILLSSSMIFESRECTNFTNFESSLWNCWTFVAAPSVVRLHALSPIFFFTKVEF